jgi:uncharacterized protein YndB with AHSA1/START domain
MNANANNPAESPADRQIVISRVFDAPRELVWEAWTNPRHVSQWWGPQGFSTTIETMDVRPGGVWRHVMHGPDGTNYPNHSVFKEVVKPERIVYSHGGRRENGPSVQFEATWTFDEVAPGKTRLTLTQTYPTAADRDFIVKEFGAIEGGKQTLGRLAGYLENLESPKRDLVITRVFDAPRELVFNVWTDPKHVVRWWGPKDFTATYCKIDLKPGGTFHFCMRSPEGKEYWNKGVYHEIVVPERIVSTIYFSDKDGNIVDPMHYGLGPGCPSEMLDMVTFAVESGTRTRLTLHRTSKPSITDQFFAGMNQGWNQSLDRFAAALKTD